MSSDTPTVLVVSNRWVPAGSGTPIVLYELFRHFRANSVRVLCGPGLKPLSNMTLPFPTTRLTVERFDHVVGAVYRRSARLALPLVQLAVEAAARRYKPRVIYGHFPDAVFATAAALTAEKLGIPFVTYFDILWSGNDQSGLPAAYEGRVARIATRRFAMTESICEHLTALHGLPFELLPHVIVPPDVRPAPVPASARRNTVHFAGNIYVNMNLDCVQRLHRVMARDAEPLELEILGFNRQSEIEQWGLTGKFVTTGSVARAALVEKQRSARVLYLPEAFEGGSPEMIRHNFPTKALEYLLTGTPILVHAPKDSYLARLARDHGWAVVVDEPHDDALAAGLKRALAGGPEIDAMADRGWEFALTRDGRTWSKVLQRALGLA